ncbi:hypothetical protein [Cupriavidus basilensis]|uniref:hypothetical protein n=1 Tax=Cupriavidus basilensis TaxID=68895 RepID=UPI0009DA8C6F|nr:hypothetical protein [Cupriavidus basilensis]
MKTQMIFPPLVELQNTWLVNIGQIKLGVGPTGEWCFRVGQRMVTISKPDDTMPLLPLLEIGRTEFYDHVRRGVQVRPELAEAVRSFPEVLLLKFAFESSVSDYWPLKAMDWLDLNSDLVSELRGELRTLQSQGWVAQRLRQRVDAAVNRCGEAIFTKR